MKNEMGFLCVSKTIQVDMYQQILIVLWYTQYQITMSVQHWRDNTVNALQRKSNRAVRHCIFDMIHNIFCAVCVGEKALQEL